MDRVKNEPWDRGCLHVYTGDGKGKTTAALGLAVRAAGRGMRTFIGQFMKGSFYGELAGLEHLNGLVVVEQFGTSECIPRRDDPAPVDVKAARDGLLRCRQIFEKGEFDIVVLDEINVAVYFNLIGEDDVMALLDYASDELEVVCTGRYASQALLARADLVTEMKCLRHPFETMGLAARDGIER